MSKTIIALSLIGNMKVTIVEETLTDNSNVYNVELRTEANRITIACTGLDKAEELFAGFHGGHFMLDSVEGISHP